MPRVSVVVRSYNRLPALCELLEVLLGQDHDSFEVVVVDQSTDVPAAAGARLAELERDPRLRVLRFPPLGGARARNAGVTAARGAVIVLVDDDDLLQAMQLSVETLGLLLEPSGAAGLAAIRVHDLTGDRLATVLTGSNLRPEHLRALAR